MKKLTVMTVLTLMVSLAYLLADPLFEVQALVVANPHFGRSAMTQTQTPRPIRTLPGVEEIRVWLGPNIIDYSIGLSNTKLTERLVTLDSSSYDMRPPAPEGRAQFYDIFYSNADGTLNADGAYLTIEAVSFSQAQGEGGGNVAEVGLRSFGSTTFEYGNTVASFVTLGANANTNSISNARDGNTQTYTTLGNTGGASQRLRITIGFLSSSGAPANPTLSIKDVRTREERGSDPPSFTVRLSAPTTSEVRVDYATEDYTALAGTDYVRTSGTLVFPPLTQEIQFSISIYIDDDPEPTERFLVNLSNPLGATISKGQGVCIILDDPAARSANIVKRVLCSEDVPKTINLGQTIRSNLVVPYDLVVSQAGLFFKIGPRGGPPRGRRPFIRLTSPSGWTLSTEETREGEVEFNGERCDSGGGVPDGLGKLQVRGNLKGTWTLTIQNRTLAENIALDCWCLEALDTEQLRRDDPDTVVDDSGAVVVDAGGNDHCYTLRCADVFNPVTVVATVVRNRSLVSGAEVTFDANPGSGDALRLTHVTTTNDQGQAEFVYTRSRSGIDNITAQVRINGRPFGEGDTLLAWDMPGWCAVGEALAGVSEAQRTLSVSRSFRDDVLARTSRGKAYTDLYYRFSSEAVQIMMFNPMMMLRSREIIERYKPVIQSMVKGEQITLTRGDLDEIDGFLNSFAAKGSPQLHQAVKEVCEDLKNPNVHNEFHITFVEGPKRNMPAHHLLQTINRAGGAAVFMGFFMAFVYCFIRARRPGGKSRHLLCLMLAMLLVISQWPLASGLSRITALPGSLRTRPENDKAARSRLSDAYGKLPLAFEANQGQADLQVSFLSRGNGYSVLLSPTEAALTLKTRGRGDAATRRLSSSFPVPVFPRPRVSASSSVLRVKLVGANPVARMAGLDEMPGKTNYFIGKDSARWRANVPNYARVKCEQVYPGIDMVYYGNQRELEYDFIVAPGADPAAIKQAFDGAEKVRLDKDGDLVLSKAGGEVRQRKPVVYQEAGGIKRIIPSRYVLIRNPQSAIRNQVAGFEIGDYDRSRPLIIDPVLAYSTYLGGSGDDEGNSITVDSSGNLYVVGFTDSVNFPTSGASQPSFGGGQQDVFVTKLNPSGTQLIYSTYLGGNGQDNGSGIAVDSAGNAYITGFTGSTNFPVRNALQPAKNGPFNAFVAKLDPSGSLLYSTHLGGSVGDFGSSITVDSSGNVYVAGVATSPNFPMVNALQSTQGGAADVYVAKLNATGTHLVYSTYLGGVADDGATSIAVDSAGNVYLTGVTSSQNFRTASPLQASHGGGLFDAFVAKVNPSGDQLVYSTYLGGSGEDRAFRIAVDSSGNAYVTGDTDSTNFPTANALQGSISGSVDAFVSKLNATGSALVFSTYLGGSGIDGATAIAVDSAGSAYAAGFTGSTNFPTIDPVQQANGGGSFDSFVSKLSPSGAALEWSTYLGGSGIDAGFGITVDSSGTAYVMGQTESTDFPTASPLQPANGGGPSDLFITKIVPTAGAGPRIADASVSGKKLFVFGNDFDSGAKILINGDSQKTSNDEQNPTTALVAKKSGKKIAPGQTVTLQVRNSDGTLSNQFSFTR